MTCHSRARQMFIDAQYQPQSSSVRVKALAVMSPTTPTRLALPPDSTGRNLRAAVPFSLLMEDVELSHVLLNNQRRGQLCVYLFISFFRSFYYFFSIVTGLSRPRCNNAATFPEPLPLLISHLWCGSSHFLVVTSSAFTLTHDTHDKLGVEVKVMGCESNAPAPTIHTLHMYTKAARYTNTRIASMCPHAISHTVLSANQPSLETKQVVVLQTGWWPGCKTHKENKTGIETLISFTNFDSNIRLIYFIYSITCHTVLSSINIFTHHFVFINPSNRKISYLKSDIPHFWLIPVNVEHFDFSISNLIH